MSEDVRGDEGISTGVSDIFNRFVDDLVVLGFDNRRLTTPVPPIFLSVYDPVLKGAWRVDNGYVLRIFGLVNNESMYSGLLWSQ